jgi:signal transduction histidine kinase
MRVLRRIGMLPLAVGAMLVLLGTLATLQYRWAGELSEAEQTRLRASARSRADAMARDFDLELARLQQSLEPRVGPGLERDEDGWAQRFAAWREQARWPGLVADVYRVSVEPGGASLTRWTPGGPEPLAWPPHLEAMRARLTHGPRGGPGFGGPRRPPFPLPDEVPSLVIPLQAGRPPGLRPPGPPGPPPPPSPPGPPGVAGPALLVVLLDLEVIGAEVLPALAERHFGAKDGLDHDLEVVGAGESSVIWRSRPGAPALKRADATARFFDLRGEAGPARRGESEGRWMLRVANHAGPLEEVVAATRRRNLAIGFGILLLLAATVTLVLVSAHRAERLGAREVEFVAAVSHELRTPVSVIQGAAENLADGVVEDAPRVRAYGTLIRDESRRLAGLVEGVLQYAGATRRTPVAERVAVAAVVQDALSALEPTLRESGFTVHTELADGLPAVLGDPHSLRQAVQNLVENAVKYDTGGRWLRVSATPSGKTHVLLSVEDRGPGIADADLPHLFEPFYRGHQARERPIRGFGLGLAFVKRAVEACGGELGVQSAQGRGATFTIRLPAAPPAAQESHALAHPSR